MSIIRHPIWQYAYFVNDIDRARVQWNKMVGAGYETACTLWGGDYVAYMDCRKDLGCYAELHGDAPRSSSISSTAGGGHRRSGTRLRILFGKMAESKAPDAARW